MTESARSPSFSPVPTSILSFFSRSISIFPLLSIFSFFLSFLPLFFLRPSTNTIKSEVFLFSLLLWSSKNPWLIPFLLCRHSIISCSLFDLLPLFCLFSLFVVGVRKHVTVVFCLVYSFLLDFMTCSRL